MPQVTNKYINKIKALTLLNNSYEVVDGKLPILISAPHSVKQVRELKEKVRDIGTGHLALYLASKTQSHLIIKSNCKGEVGKTNDDANFCTPHPYKSEILKIIKSKNIKALIDLHSLRGTRKTQICIGVNGGANIQQNTDLLAKIVTIFKNHSFNVSIDYPFNAPLPTVAGYTAKHAQIFSLQFEINSRLININHNENKFNKICRAFKEVIKLLAETL